MDEKNGSEAQCTHGHKFAEQQIQHAVCVSQSQHGCVAVATVLLTFLLGAWLVQLIPVTEKGPAHNPSTSFSTQSYSSLQKKIQLVSGVCVVCLVLHARERCHQGILSSNIQVVVQLPVDLSYFSSGVKEALHGGK